MKVGIITKYAPPQHFIANIALNLKKIKPIILAYMRLTEFDKRESAESFYFKLPPDILTYYLWDGGLLKRLISNINYFKYKIFEKAIIKENIKLLHVQFADLGFEVLPLKKKYNIPLIIHCRGKEIFHSIPNDKIKLNTFKKVFKHGDLLLPVSEHMRKHLIKLGCPENKVKTYYGGVDLNLFKFTQKKLDNKNDEIRILMCGRFVEKKDFPSGIKAFYENLKNYRNIKLQIIGCGELKMEIMKLIKDLKIENKICMLGELSPWDVSKVMSKAHIFLMPFVTGKKGNSEGIPNVLKEAQATGLPVISTCHAGVPEVVIDGETGFLVKEKDVKGLSKRLDYLIQNPSLWIKFGEKGRKLIEKKFDLNTQIQKLESIYEKFIRE